MSRKENKRSRPKVNTSILRTLKSSRHDWNSACPKRKKIHFWIRLIRRSWLSSISTGKWKQLYSILRDPKRTRRWLFPTSSKRCPNSYRFRGYLWITCSLILVKMLMEFFWVSMGEFANMVQFLNIMNTNATKSQIKILFDEIDQ